MAMNVSVSSVYIKNKHTENGQGAFVVYSIEYSHYLNRPQNLVVPTQSGEQSSCRKNFSEYFDDIQVFQKFLVNKHYQYADLINGFPVKTRKSDGIFPFHYHW